MRVLCIHPGASYSTADVYNGIVDALSRHGVEIIRYALDARIYHAGSWLELAYRRKKKIAPDTPKPTSADVQYHASLGAIERALRFQPDWVIVVSAMYFHPDIIAMLKRAGLRVGVVFTESPYDDLKQAKVAAWVDAVWTHERASLPYLRMHNPNTFYLRHAIDPGRHSPNIPVPASTPAHDVVFVGTGFQERCDVLAAVDWEGIDLGLYGTWSLLGSRSKLRRYVRGEPMDNRYAVQLYRAAKIGLNLHRTSLGFGRDAEHTDVGESVNPRALELAACGVFTISDYRPEMDDIFGELVPTFTDPSDLGDMVRSYLERDRERQRIARLLPDAVAGETFDVRVEQMLDGLACVERQAVSASQLVTA